MIFSKFSNTDLMISKIGLGTWVFGGDGWGDSAESDCLAAVSAAKDMGINLIDTAPVYGVGRAEEIIGKALKGQRAHFIIATKCGLVWNGKKVKIDLSPANVRREIEASLKRMALDFIDIYQCHWPDPVIPFGDTLHTLQDLKKDGKIRYIGVSNFPVPLLREAFSEETVISTQNPYSLLNRTIEDEILPIVNQKKMGLFTYGSLAGGILSGKYKTPAEFLPGDVRKFFYKFYQGDKFEKVSRLIRALTDFNKPLHQLAINWVRQQEGVTSVLVGCRNVSQVKENAASVSWEFSPAQITQIRELMTRYGF